MNEPSEPSEFSARLAELCDDWRMPVRGRQTALAKRFEVTPNAARKWLLGHGLPEMALMIKIAKAADVRLEWLASGRGPKRERMQNVGAFLVAEAIERLPQPVRHEVLDFITWQLERAGALFSAEQLSRYSKAISALNAPQDTVDK